MTTISDIDFIKGMNARAIKGPCRICEGGKDAFCGHCSALGVVPIWESADILEAVKRHIPYPKILEDWQTEYLARQRRNTNGSHS